MRGQHSTLSASSLSGVTAPRPRCGCGSLPGQLGLSLIQAWAGIALGSSGPEQALTLSAQDRSEYSVLRRAGSPVRELPGAHAHKYLGAKAKRGVDSGPCIGSGFLATGHAPAREKRRGAWPPCHGLLFVPVCVLLSLHKPATFPRGGVALLGMRVRRPVSPAGDPCSSPRPPQGRCILRQPVFEHFLKAITLARSPCTPVHASQPQA